MASSAVESSQQQTSWPAQNGQYDAYIEQRLKKTRLHVKLVELFAALMVLASGVLAFLLVLAVVDAWVVDLGRWGRTIGLLILLGGSVAYCVMFVLPLLLKRINPVFAARAIEEAKPSLKNSLVNFLLFRSNRGGVHQKIYEGLESQAASGLSQVELESAVDRSRLIKIGYVLAGIMIVCGAYKILSPKDPFQTVSRVAAPFAEIQRPSRVQIAQSTWVAEIKPGDTHVIHDENPQEHSAAEWHEVTNGEVKVLYGQALQVSAQVSGADESDPVTLYYSTLDGQTIDAPISMQANESGLYHECELSLGAAGIQQDLSYYIAAGDARTKKLSVKVRTAPSITVRRIELHYPKYTEQKDRVIEGQGDVQAIEGTRVRIQAEANLPIRTAYVELNPSVGDDASAESSATKTIPMKWNGQQAEGEFYLELQADRQTPVADRYCIRFETEDGERNDPPLIHRIEVTPDLAPEIEILSPDRDRIELPVNRTAKIEVRALDPDFALTRIKLHAVYGGVELLDLPLLDNAEIGDLRPLRAHVWNSIPALPRVIGAAVQLPLEEVIHWIYEERNSVSRRKGQATVSFRFTPSEYKLRPNDEVVYWAVAEDNRTSVRHQLPEPNAARTRNFYIKVLPPVGGSDEESRDQDPKSKPPEQDPNSEKSDDQSAKGGQGSGSEKADGTENAEKGTTGGTSGGSGTDNKGQNPPPNAGGANSAENGSNDKSPKDKGSSDNATRPSDGTDGSNDSANQPKPLENGDGNSADAGQQQTGSGGTDGGKIEQAPQPSNRDEPIHDGEAIERIKEFLEKQKKDKSENGGDGTNQNSQSRDSDAQNDTTDGGNEKDETQNASPDKPTQNSDTQSNDTSKTPNDVVKPDKQPGQTQGQERPAGQGSDDNRTEEGTGQQQPKEKKQPGQGDDAQQGVGQDDKNGSKPSPDKGTDEGPKTNEQKSDPDGTGELPKSKTADGKKPDSNDGADDSNRGGSNEEGSGQGANQPGQDTAGSTSPADAGAGAASEPGKGDTSKRPGEKAKSDGTDGTAGSEKGPGSNTSQKDSGDQTSKKPGEKPGKQGDTPFGGSNGTSDADSTSQPYAEDELPEAEKANLEYARKATDLVLENLKEQKDAPDSELLDDLGWTEDDLRKFIERWEGLKRNAKEGGTAQQRELDEALRSLGLRPASAAARRAGTEKDAFRGLRDNGVRAEPPADYLEQFNAFIKGAARAGNSE